jgi:ubiquinone/menaquinone biosynthesis C-methylase UbiE
MPPRRIRYMGRTLSFIVARAPWLWPLMRRPVTRFWNRMAEGWGQRVSPDRTVSLEAGVERVGSPQRILEVGSGTGSGAAVLRSRFPDAEITGTDLSEEMVQRARANVPSVDFQVADASALPFPDGSFDLVSQLNVPVYFKELARVVAPGGCILVASTFGPATPYYTPHSVLRRKFTRLGLEVRAAEPAPPGDIFIACRPS